MFTIDGICNGISHEKRFVPLMCAVPNMAVFSSLLISFFPGKLLRYFLNAFQMVPIAASITDIIIIIIIIIIMKLEA